MSPSPSTTSLSQLLYIKLHLKMPGNVQLQISPPLKICHLPPQRPQRQNLSASPQQLLYYDYCNTSPTTAMSDYSSPTTLRLLLPDYSSLTTPPQLLSTSTPRLQLLQQYLTFPLCHSVKKLLLVFSSNSSSAAVTSVTRTQCLLKQCSVWA